TALADGTATLQGSVDGLTASLAGINQKFDDVSAALAGLDTRIIELEKRPLTQGLPSSAIKAYERELEDLKASVAEQRAEAAAMEENAKQTAQQALARAALTRVLSALDAGQGFRAPLTDLVTATGTPAPQILDDLADSGVVSLATLQSSYPEAARAALAAARKVEGTSGNRFLSFMQSQLGARSVTPQEGDGADAVLSRAEAALRTGNLTDVLAELDTLPDPAKPAIAAWLETAKTRQAALSAGNALSAQLNSN
ncbi:MAG: COG4223 family protein, partial [Cognatishimia sp.]|uniref:COG4223 family protein n=1 Tax=Cognatishimia sp. TaxID=2211648 RepID=UPI004059638D